MTELKRLLDELILEKEYMKSEKKKQKEEKMIRKRFFEFLVQKLERMKYEQIKRCVSVFYEIFSLFLINQ